MKKCLSILIVVLLLVPLACDPKGSDPGGESAAPEQSQNAAIPTATPVPDPADYVSPEFDSMRLDKLEYGKDYVSLYDKVGADASIADVVEDKATGLAYMEVDGEMRVLGLDFLAKAMIRNTAPAGGFETEEDVYAEWWRLYIQRWNKLLPELPIYRTEYYDIYNTEIKGVDENPLTAYFDLSQALIYWRSEKEDNSIAVAVSSDITGAFRYPAFGVASRSASAPDTLISALVSGVGLVSKTKDGGYAWNDSVLRSHEKTTDADGNTVYTFVLKDDLKFSDGSKIGAKDFLAMQMVLLSAVFEEASSIAADGSPILGWEREYEYYAEVGGNGKKTLRGLRLVDENTFSVTLKKTETSDFYSETFFERFNAQYADAWLNGFEIFDDGDGCYLSDGFYNKTDGVYDMEAHLIAICSDYSEKMLAKYPWAGAYVPVSAVDYEYEEHYVPGGISAFMLKRNEYYMGNYEGQKPEIEKVVFAKVPSALMVSEFANGKIDMVNSVVGSVEIDELKHICNAMEDGKAATTHYSRAGYGKLAFRADLGPVQFAEVRQALAYCLDRDYCANYWGRNACSVISAPYNEDSWMYKKAAKRGLLTDNYGAVYTSCDMEYDAKGWDEAAALKKAKELLEACGWIYNEQGGPYENGVRYKRIPADVIDEKDMNYTSLDGKYGTVQIGEYCYMPLVINFYKSIDDDMFYFIFSESEVFKNAGFSIQMIAGDFYSLINEFYQANVYGYHEPDTEAPKYCMFNFATSFAGNIYDHSAYYHTIDPELYYGNSQYFLKDYADIYFIG
ncbi:MAG: hypothetical protein IKS90_00310 [Clostridia bacterium]|nr:hypothetical protein [Clostridia bacterium]